MFVFLVWFLLFYFIRLVLFCCLVRLFVCIWYCVQCSVGMPQSQNLQSVTRRTRYICEQTDFSCGTKRKESGEDSFYPCRCLLADLNYALRHTLNAGKVKTNNRCRIDDTKETCAAITIHHHRRCHMYETGKDAHTGIHQDAILLSSKIACYRT